MFKEEKESEEKNGNGEGKNKERRLSCLRRKKWVKGKVGKGRKMEKRRESCIEEKKMKNVRLTSPGGAAGWVGVE